MATSREAAQYLGRTGLIKASGHDGIKFRVRVIDTRTTYSKVHLFCEPVSGDGAKWFSLDSITFDQDSLPEERSK